jgi:magnesium transporter
MPEVSPSPGADESAEGETETSDKPDQAATLNWTGEVGRLRTEQIAFFPLLEIYGERVEALENDVVERPESVQISEIHNLKRDLLTIRRAVWPQREMLNTLVREESTLITRKTRLFLRDCYDHTVQLMDLIETYREIASGLVDIQLASVNNRMNEVMKVLTMIATIFIPLTFVAGF